MSVMRLELRCLVLPNDKPESSSFVVRIDGDHYVSDLKEAIKTKMAPQLKNVDAPTLPLWKCAIPMGQKIIESVRLDNTDDRVSHIEGECRLSELSIEGLPSNTFHILAQIPDDSGPPSKRARFTGPEAIEPRPLQASEGDRRDEIMYLLYDGLWKKGVKAWTKITRIVEEHVPDPSVALGEAQESDLDPPDESEATTIDLVSLLKWTPVDVIRSPTPIFLVRGEYTELEKFSESQSNHVLLLGQPGIGKTVYLTYSLLRRLIAGLPTIFAKSPINRYIFLDSGVYWIPNKSFQMSRHPAFTNCLKNTLVLFDLNEEQSTPEEFGDWKILVSSSPRSERYKEWVKQRNAETWVMRPWSWDEIYLARETATNKYSLKRLFEAFCKYGGTARNLLNKPPERLEEEIRTAIKKCTDFSTLFLTSTDFHDKTSHALITINPDVDEADVLQRWAYQGIVTSPYILDLLVILKDSQFANGMKDTLKMLIRNGFTRSPGGVLFEARGHSYLLKCLESPLNIRPLSTGGNPISVNLKHVQRISFFKDLPTSFKDLNNGLYYQLLSATISGIDSFALEVDDEGMPTSVVCFRFTVNENCPLSFLSNLWTKGVLAAKTTQWKLVFIVPLENEPKFQTQKWESEDDTWSRRISQYVIGVNIDEFFTLPQQPLQPTTS